MKRIRLSDIQFNELNEEKIYINIDSFDLMPLYKLNWYWKEFAYDLLAEMFQKNLLENLYYYDISLTNKENLLIFIKNNYKILIENHKLNIDFRDYVELNDYVTLKEWLSINNHNIEQNANGIFLFIEN